jgi:hypothetical protein
MACGDTFGCCGVDPHHFRFLLREASHTQCHASCARCPWAIPVTYIECAPLRHVSTLRGPRGWLGSVDCFETAIVLLPTGSAFAASTAPTCRATKTARSRAAPATSAQMRSSSSRRLTMGAGPSSLRRTGTTCAPRPTAGRSRVAPWGHGSASR